jgi:hypothetical protein
MNMKLLLANIGHSVFNRVKGYLSSLLRRKKVRLSPQTQERQRFEEDVRGQFVELKKKGLSIPIFTL